MNPSHFDLKSFKEILLYNKESQIKQWSIGISIILLVILLLPWTQNIKTQGTITALYQDDRPQEINSPISGRIEKWFIKEGDYVKKGDTILQLSEVKAEYLDPQLIQRTKEQLQAKKNMTINYSDKVETDNKQIIALQNLLNYELKQINRKIEQLNNKLSGEKAELVATEIDLNLALDQFNRQQKMYEQGLVSQTQLQQRSLQYQNTIAKKNIIENKIKQTEREIDIQNIELINKKNEYLDKINKEKGEQLLTMSQIENNKFDMAKLENLIANYTLRNSFYHILAPQEGQIIQVIKSGIGEIVKEQEKITIIVPKDISHSVELYINPFDMPLINIGQEVRLVFDGFPAIIFSGWPENSYGTFSGKIISFESNINQSGKYSVFVTQDSTKKQWPKTLIQGGGVKSIILLNDVPLWYELWRNINGFPPDFYTTNRQSNKEIK